MNISLSPETQELLERKLKTGAYPSADAVVQAALEALDKIDALDDSTFDAIDRAEDQIERGEVHDWKDVREQVRAKFLGNRSLGGSLIRPDHLSSPN
jgi:Arc/MetJ-type ribon-helix-helix transcriptional regulator